jgi:hypothetical protein
MPTSNVFIIINAFSSAALQDCKTATAVLAFFTPKWGNSQNGVLFSCFCPWKKEN